MLNASRKTSGVARTVASRTSIARRARRKRQYGLESLESRTLLTFTITWNSLNNASVTQTPPPAISTSRRTPERLTWNGARPVFRVAIRTNGTAIPSQLDSRR